MENKQQQQLNNKIEFQGVRNSYPLNENLYCYFTIQNNGSTKPESGDWVGIYKTGWTSLKDCKSRKMVKVEDMWGKIESCGQVIFDAEILPRETEHFYQFVYVKNGDLIRGASMPFVFEVTEQKKDMKLNPVTYKYNPIEGEYTYQPTQWKSTEQKPMTQWKSTEQKPMQPWTTIMPTWTNKPTTIKCQYEQGLPTEVKQCVPQYIKQGIQHQYEQVFPTEVRQGVPQYVKQGVPQYIKQGVPQYVKQGIQHQYEQGLPTEVRQGVPTYIKQGIQHLIKNMKSEWIQPMQSTMTTVVEQIIQDMPRIQKWTKIETPEKWQMMIQQIIDEFETKINQQPERDQRRREQSKFTIQINLFERLVQEQQRKESEIQEQEELRVKKQTGEFRQKVQSIMKITCDEPKPEMQIAQYVNKFETLLREKMQLETEKRQKIQTIIIQAIRQCQKQLKELEQYEIQFGLCFQQQVEQHLRELYQQFIKYEWTENVEKQFFEQLKNIELSIFEQTKEEQKYLRQTHFTLREMIDEIYTQLEEEFEFQGLDKQFQETIFGNYKQQVNQQIVQLQKENMTKLVQKLEQQLYELKKQLKGKYTIELQGQYTESLPVEWIKQLVQKLREVEYCLKQEKLELFGLETIEKPVRNNWLERRLEKMNAHIKFFENQMIIFQQPEQFELYEVLVENLRQLKDLECELIEQVQGTQEQACDSFILVGQQTIKSSTSVYCPRKEVQELIKEKINGLKKFFEQTPIGESQFIYKLFSQITTLENKLIEAKNLITLKEQKQQQFIEKFVDFEQTKMNSLFVEREFFTEKLQGLKEFLQQIKQQKEQFYQSEQFLLPVQLRKQYEKLMHLVGELEIQLVEHQKLMQQVRMVPTTFQCEEMIGEQQTKKYLEVLYQIKDLKINFPYLVSQYQYDLKLEQFHKKFLQLVEEFLGQFPTQNELYYKIQKLVQLVRQIEIRTIEQQKPEYFFQQSFKLHQLAQELHQHIKYLESLLVEEQSFSLYHQTFLFQLREILTHIQYWINNKQQQKIKYPFTYEIEQDFLNNNYPSFVYEVIGEIMNLNEITHKFNNARYFEQENIIAELVQKYITSLYKPTNEEFRRKFEQLFVENNKLGLFLRKRVQEIVQLKRQFEEIQTVKSLFDGKFLNERKTEQIERQLNGQFLTQFITQLTGMDKFNVEEIKDKKTYYIMPTSTQSTEIVDEILEQLEGELMKVRLNKPKQTTPITFQYQSTIEQENMPENGLYFSVEGYLPTSFTTTKSTKQEEAISQLKKQISQLNPRTILKIEEEQKTTITSCPVCGISTGKELAEFELHVNGHFSD
jgi:hypothetical protein